MYIYIFLKYFYDFIWNWKVLVEKFWEIILIIYFIKKMRIIFK